MRLVRGRAVSRGPRGEPDNLQRIKGIGRVNEQKLNELGIFHFDQIAQWTRAEIRWVGTYLSFPGRIDREKWVEQAANFAAGPGRIVRRSRHKGVIDARGQGPHL